LRQSSNKIVENELLIIEVQQLEDFFRIVHKNLRVCFNILVLGLADFSTERSKWGLTVLRYCCRKPHTERAMTVQQVLALQTRIFVHKKDVRTGSFRHNRSVTWQAGERDSTLRTMGG
jgi:hypothetical protein